MVETGKVTKLKGDRITVRFPRKTACENCHMCLKSPDDMYVEITVDNGVGARVGDTVSVDMGASYVLSSAVICYLMPLIFAAIGLVVGVTVWNETVGIAGCFGMLAIGFAVCHLIDKRLKKKSGFSPMATVIVERAKEDDNERID